jgi:acyl transferase domain-containing protein/NAD(P)H-dependent flavin oxidoreductase YrpB (nitropropane dioxygenase family)
LLVDKNLKIIKNLGRLKGVSLFACFSISSISLAHPGIAVATVRAGGIGILDREFCSDWDLHQKSHNLNQLLDLVGHEKTVGLRLRVSQIESSQPLLKRLAKRSHWLILCRWDCQSLLEELAKLPLSQSRKIMLEVTDIEQVAKLSSLSVAIDGLLAKGHESGGWIGEDPAFILTQKLLRIGNYPVYVQGGIGIHTAAACQAAGAAGVILDDQLWLMPESPLSSDWQKYLLNLNGQEAIPIGERLDAPLRVLSRPNFTASKRLQELAEELEIQEEAQQKWHEQAEPLIGWGEPGVTAWPIGQGIGLAETIRQSYPTTGKFIQALLQESRKHLLVSQKLQPLQPNSSLAVAHKTTYPIVQGPMTRVSDVAEFAAAVSEGGALPLLALALMSGEQVEKLLRKVNSLLGNCSWGVGILGFVPQALREEQLKAVLANKPPFALIAGGRPDQAAKLESQGITTYIHVPTPSLLSMFIEQGGKRFIFEGRECGGHVGPLSSFVLWENSIETLLKQIPVGNESEYHILFAGGIHDAASAAMVSAMAAPLAERGFRIGVLMGSAYLFTEEAVACGAIAPEYQKQALQCKRTINLETGPGHASRCAITPFAQEFYATRRQMLAAGESAENIKNTLEDLTLGRLRVASKGLVRKEGNITEVDASTQLKDGMYMIGQVATMRDRVCTIKKLHQEVSETSTRLLLSLKPAVDLIPSQKAKSSDIAIVGIGTLLPKAQAADVFWENILAKVNAITEIPAHRWDWRLYYDRDRSLQNKVYSRWGGFLEDVPFDPMRFGIPPKSLKSIEPMQLLALEAVRRALADAGYEKSDFDRENTSVILGASGGVSDLGQQYAARCEIPRMVEHPDPKTWERLPEWTEESFPGLLFNVTAGRVANRFDLGGSNYTVDAACASSLAAVDLAVAELENGRCNVAIAGGIDTVQSPFAYFCFSKTSALSPQGVARSFDQGADGIVISEGLAVLVLKRLADAERDGDKIYAVIKAVASSSDGKGLSMTAPASAGQKRALARAYQKANINPNTLGLYEAHGTGTAAGDKAELQTIVSVLQEHQAQPKSCTVGSVKTMIGHTKSSAGITALIKAALSLHYKVLPPHTNVERPLEPLQAEDSPVYLLQEAKPWLRHPEHPRRAGVSAFGFGGTNFHALLEEYSGEFDARPQGAKAWSCELLLWRSRDAETLTQELNTLKDNLIKGAQPRLRDLAYTLAKQAEKCDSPTVALSLVVENQQQLLEFIDLVLAQLQGNIDFPLPPQIQLELSANAEPIAAKGKIAFIFPGQVAQYSGMAREIAMYFPEMTKALEYADSQLQRFFPQLLSQYLYPPGAYSEAEAEKAEEQLTDTHIAQPTIGAVETGYLDLLKRLDLHPDMVAGHSYGEYAALHAAGAISRQEFLKLSEIRGRVMAAACKASEGAMAAVKATREELLLRLQNNEDVIIANHNAPCQTVISGKTEAVQTVVEQLQVAQIMARMLPVAGAFHSSLIESAQSSLARAIASAPMQLPTIPIYSNVTARPYENNLESIRHQLSQQLVSPVEFVAEINQMYAAGARIFIEVGPKQIMTRLVNQILEGKDYLAVSLDGHGRGLKGFLIGLGTLFNKGIKFNLLALYQGRDCQQLNLKQLWQLTKKPELPPNTWLVNGGSVRRSEEKFGLTGKIPPLTQETISAISVSNSNNVNSSNGKEKMTSDSNSILPIVSNSNQSDRVSNDNSNHIKPISGEAALLGYQAYQQTMREFLKVQEQVMKQFLHCLAVEPTLSVMPPSLPYSLETNRVENVVEPVPQSNSNGQIIPSSHQQIITQTQNNPQPIVQELPPERPPQPQLIVAPSPSSQPQSNTLDRANLTDTLLELVSDRTGYPKDMLGLDQDMEAELGIDSIKRVEIFGALLKHLPESTALLLQEEMETFTQAKSLNKLIDSVLAKASTAINLSSPTNSASVAEANSLVK